MENNNDVVFRSWNIGDNIGSGTDGRVSYITRKDNEGKTVKAVLKTIFFHENRNEPNDFNKLGKMEKKLDSEIREILESVTGNIDLIMEIDNGKRFVKYEEYEVRPTKDGYVLYIRLEQMRSLENLLTQFSLTRDEALKIAIAICRGLIRCRKFGYVYPNLKPENILFDAKGRCKLGDFGSFSCLEPEKASLAFRKSEYYMAPEYVKSGKINTTCDTYSLGLILYMLTNRGRLPFSEAYPQPVTINGLDNSKNQRINGTRLPKPVLADDELFELIKKACAYEPAQRYLSPSQMLADLKNIAAGKPIEKPVFEEVYSNTPDNRANQSANTYASAKTNNTNAAYSDFVSNMNVNVPPSPSSTAPGPLPSLEEILAGKSWQEPQPAPRPQPQPQPRPKKQPVKQEEQDEEEIVQEPRRHSSRQGGKKQSDIPLKERIKVPNVKPRDYRREKKPGDAKQKKNRSRFFVGDLPQTKKDKAQTADIKKLSIILIAIVLCIVLLITSASIRAKYKKEEAANLPQASVSDTNNGDSNVSLDNNAEPSVTDDANTDDDADIDDDEPDAANNSGVSENVVYDENGVPVVLSDTPLQVNE